MLVKLCADCGKIIELGNVRCNECQAKWDMQHKSDVKVYDQTCRRNTDIYNTTKWRRLTLRCKQRFNNVDIYQYYINNKLVYGSLSHHILDIDEDRSKALDIDNLIWVSGSINNNTHAEIHKAYDRSKQSKKDMQKLLLKLVDRWDIEYNK